MGAVQQCKKQPRQSNLELMRIIAMLMIIAGHFCSQSGFAEGVSGTAGWLIACMGAGARIAVNMFLVLGVWFMVDTEFKAIRIVKLYLQAWFLIVPITLLLVGLGYNISKITIIKSIEPFFLGGGVWFVNTYIALIMLSPWLHKLLLLERKSLRCLLIVASLITTVMFTVHAVGKAQDSWLDTVVWFAFIYLLIGYYKKYLSKEAKYNKWYMLLSGGLLYLIIVTVVYITSGSTTVMLGGIHHVMAKFLVDFKTLPNLLIALSWCYFFLKLDIGTNKYINFFAAGALSVYVVHQTPAFYPILWRDIYKTSSWVHNDNAVLHMLLVVISCYVVISCMDYIRRKIIEPIIINSRAIRYVENKIDDFYR